MAKFTITHLGSSLDEGKKSEDVQADDFIDEGDWISRSEPSVDPRAE